MNYFLRALKEAWRHWAVLAGALTCSLLAAALWGANIAAMFPIIETTLNGKSIPEWNQQRLTDAEKRVKECQNKIATLEREIPRDVPEDQQKKQLEIEFLRTRVWGAESTAASAKKIQPFLDSYDCLHCRLGHSAEADIGHQRSDDGGLCLAEHCPERPPADF